MKKIYILLLFSIFLNAADVIKKDGKCIINWTKYTLTCKGMSASNQSRYAALVSAKIIAQRNMLEKIKGIRINSVTTFEDGIKKSDIIRAVVKGAIKGSRVVSEYYDPDERYGVVEVEIDLIDDILIKILKTNISENLLKKFFSPFFLYASEYSYEDLKTLEKLLDDFRASGNSTMVRFLENLINKIKSSKITGVVIDAKDVKNFDLALLPKIRDINGKEIYPLNYVSEYEIVNSHGIVDYEVGSFEEVKNKKRVKNNPILLKAKGIYGKRKSDLVLTKSKYEILKEVDSSVFKNAKVVILVGE